MPALTKLLLLLFLLGSAQGAKCQAEAVTKYALLFGIGNYPQEKGWPEISSVRDVELIKDALLRQGFAEENIETIEDSAATKQKIIDRIKQLSARVKENDIVLIHFSSHGEQVQDLNGDESDGLDEAIVTYNSVAPGKSTDFMKDRAEYLTDDELGESLKTLRARLGRQGDLLVLMDLCHSGSGTRGIAKVRGDQPPLVSKEFHAVQTVEPKSFSGDLPIDGSNSLSSFTVISAAKANELDYETLDDSNTGMGSLSYALIKALEELDPNTTYRSLFSKIQAIMNLKSPMQHPVIEGADLSREIFGGNYTYQQPYAEVDQISGNRIRIKSGSLSGFTPGSVVGLYKSGTLDYRTATALTKGKVLSSDFFSAEIELDSVVDINPSLTWVFTITPNYALPVIGLKLVSSKTAFFTTPDETAIKKSIAELPVVRMSNHPELLLVKGDGVDTLKFALSGAVFSLTNTDQLKDELIRYCQYKFLKTAEAKQNGLNVSVRLATIRNAVLDTNTNKKNSGYEFYDGDQLKILVRNNGKERIFINVLDLQPDGKVNAVFPNRTKSIYPDDLSVEPGTEKIFPVSPSVTLTVSPPYGTEVFKIFIATEPLDLESIAESRGTATRGNLSFLEYLVKDSYTLSRGIEMENTTTEENGSTMNIVFEVRPAPFKN